MILHEPDPVRQYAHDGQGKETAHRKGGGDRDPGIIQALQDEHPGELPFGHADGFHHGKFFLPGYDPGQDRIDEVQDPDHTDDKG